MIIKHDECVIDTAMSDIYDKVYEALAHEQRRRLLFGLVEKNPQTDSPIDLDTPPDGVLADETDRIEYKHVHLPKLEEYGFIEWTPSISCVERGPRFDEIRPLLERLAEHHEKHPARQ